MTDKAPYALSGIYNDENALTDICCTNSKGKFYILGDATIEREHKIVENLLKKLAINKASNNEVNLIPVFLGAGMGNAILSLLSEYDVAIAIIDKEKNLLELTQINTKLNARQKPLLIDSDDAMQVLDELTQWQLSFDLSPPAQLIPILHPFYARVDRNFYSFLYEEINKISQANIYKQAIFPRFQFHKPKILFLSPEYCLTQELMNACDFLNIEYQLAAFPMDMPRNNFIEQLLSEIVQFKPDVVITFNNKYIDKEKILLQILQKFQLPLASWCVDNPELLRDSYINMTSPWVSIFAWDLDNVPGLKNMGYQHIFHLPLATNPQRFKPISTKDLPEKWFSDVSFVGTSMLYSINDRLSNLDYSQALLDTFKEISAKFNNCEVKSVREFIFSQPLYMVNIYENLKNDSDRLKYEAAITWEATRQYRTNCVEQLMDFKPLIVGDDGWNILLKDFSHMYNYHHGLFYYTELPRFYPCSTINFNCTSQQMKGAVNQRIFDVPASSSFVLTDWREQMDDLFEPEKEIISFKEPGEIPELVDYYLKNDKARNNIVKAARKRILAEHTWAHRLQTLLKHMKDIYGISSLAKIK